MTPIRLPIRTIDRKNNIVWVKSKENIFPCKFANELDGMSLGDDAIIVKSAVSNEWLCISYAVDTPTNYAIHNSYQEDNDLIEEGLY